jgi:adenylate cyclase
LTRQDEKTKQLRLVHVTELAEKWITQAYQMYVQAKAEKFSIHSDGKGYIVNIAFFPQSFISDWRILVIIPEEDLLGPVNALFLQVGLISLGIFLLSMIFVYVFAGKVTNPITQLAIEMEKIKNLHLDDITPVQSNIKELDMMNSALLSTTQGLHSFRKYVPADLVRQLIQIGQEVKLGGEETELTIMFSDITGFTSISEEMPAQELMLHLSEYFENFTHLIMQEQGTIDKYIGDGILAFWGAPVKLTEAAHHACRAVLACQNQLQELNAKWSTVGKPLLHTRIGLHTGNTVVGNLGSADRMNYTIIGDSVNLASRLESANSLYGTNIIISEATHQQVSEQFYCRPLDIVAVKGKRHSVKIYELIAAKTTLLSVEIQQFCTAYTAGLEAYLRQDWSAALVIFYDLQGRFPTDKSVQLLISRCQEFQLFPDKLPPEWNGVVTLTDK